MASYNVDVVAGHSCSTTGEGPHWHDGPQNLLYVDIEAGFIHKWNPESQLKTAIQLDGMVSAIVPCKKGGYMICTDLSLARLDWDSQHVHRLHTVEEGKANRLNDAKCDASGRLWAGTMPLNNDGNAWSLARNQGALYSLETDGSLVKRLGNISLSNGLAWNKANDTMFYIDSLDSKVYAFDFDLQSGNMTNQKVAHKLNEGEFPDGMCIDEHDKLWVAVVGPGEIRRIDPENGSILQTVDIPGTCNTTSCCFGGKGYTDLFVTSFALGVPTNEKRLPIHTDSGSVFRVAGLGVKGLPAYEYGS